MFIVFSYFEFLQIIVFVKVLWAVNCDSAKVQGVLWGTIEKHFEHMKGLKMFSFKGI